MCRAPTWQCTKSAATENKNQNQARNHTVLRPSSVLFQLTQGMQSSEHPTLLSYRPASRCPRKQMHQTQAPRPARALQRLPIQYRDAGPAELRTKRNHNLQWECTWYNCVCDASTSACSNTGGSGTTAAERNPKPPLHVMLWPLLSTLEKQVGRHPSVQLHRERAWDNSVTT